MVDLESQDEKVTNEELLAEDVDVLIVAALGDAITGKNSHAVKAKIILELANGPVNEDAYEALIARKVLIVPDILANAGGVIVSYLEWFQNKNSEKWTEDIVNKKLEDYMVRAVDSIWSESIKSDMTLKEAAFAVAMKRILSK